MVGVESFYLSRLCGEAPQEVGFRETVAGKGSRLVAQLPSQDGGTLAVGSPSDTAGAPHQLTDGLQREILRLLGEPVTRVLLLEERPVVATRRAGTARPPQESTETAAPVPCIVEIEDAGHATLLQLLEQIVQTLKQFAVELASPWFHYGRDAGSVEPVALRGSEHADVGDAVGTEHIQFTPQTLAVAARSLAAQRGCIPHVNSHVFIGFAATDEALRRGLHELLGAYFERRKSQHDACQEH